MAIYIRNEQGDLSALQIPAIRGKSAYEIAQVNGFEGTEQEWLNSLRGKNGANGQDGADGTTPVKGTDYYTQQEKEDLIIEILNRIPNGNEVAY